MPATLTGDDDAHKHFLSGYKDRHAPLTSTEKKMLRFSNKSFSNLADRDTEIRSKFGMHSVDYYRKLEALKDHPQLGKQTKSRLTDLMSTPGPMTGGSQPMTGKQFSHGLDW